MTSPIVIVSPFPPRLCSVSSFCEEALEYITRQFPRREVMIVSHTDGRGDGVLPLIDLGRADWWKTVARRVNDLEPYVVHLQHEYDQYEYRDEDGRGDGNQGFLNLLDALDYPTVVEPHSLHGRLLDHEADFIHGLCRRADMVLVKFHYQRWRLGWTFPQYGWTTPRNVMVVPRGCRPDMRWGVSDVPKLRKELGLDKKSGLSRHVVGMVGWMGANKRWDVFLDIWEEVAQEIRERTGQDWDLLAAGAMRDPKQKKDVDPWVAQTRKLQAKGLAYYYEFIPRGEMYYKMMAICDFIVLPVSDEIQSGAMARIIALNKPFITTAPMEGLTAVTVESQGGMLFTSSRMLKENVLRLACDEKLRMSLGENLRRYLEEVVSWEVVARQYGEAYEMAAEARRSGTRVDLPYEF
ncbi:MAG: hypothetical protein U9P14_04755 [Gemmatimonadota bacterium]|nr:hypothetical protein [Gemmatimonadota bacterium]